MAGGIDRLYARQAKVPQEFRLNKRCEEGTTGSIDVDRNVESCLRVQLVESNTDLANRLELEGERHAESNNDADSVFVAALEDFVWSEQEAVTLHGNFANFDVEVAAELVPANLDWTHDQVRSFRRLSFGTPAFPPVPLEGEAAEHGCLAGAGGRTTDGAGGFRGMPYIGEHVDAALFDCRGLRIFILVDHVLVGGLVHQLLDFSFDPGRAESGEILLGVAVEYELIVDGLIDPLRVLFRLGELVAPGPFVMNVELDLAGGCSFKFFGVVQGHQCALQSFWNLQFIFPRRKRKERKSNQG